MTVPGGPRVVFDCMVFLQGAARATGPSAACLQLAEEGVVTLCLSAAVLAEVREVLARPGLQRKFPILTPGWVDELLMRLLARAELIASVAPVFECPRDPKDEKYVDLALAAGASYLVTRDNDLLDLMKPDEPAGIEFRTGFPGLTILGPAALLRLIRSGAAR